MTPVDRIRRLCEEHGIAISRLEKELGFSNGYFRNLKKGGIPIERLEKIAEYFHVSTDYLRLGEAEQDYIYTITGDSMAPELPNGTQLVVHAQDYADNGDVVIVRQNGSESVRRLMAYHDAVMLLAFNQAYPPELLDGEIVGRVIESRRKW